MGQCVGLTVVSRSINLSNKRMSFATALPGPMAQISIMTLPFSILAG